MYKVTLRGDYYEMGYRYGRILRQIQFRPPRAPDRSVRFARKCERAIGEYFPQILEELQGLSESADIKYDDLLTLVLTLGNYPKSNCTCLVAIGDATKNRKPLLGRNYDFYYKYKNSCGLYQTNPKNMHSSIANTDILVGREDGINDSGLAIVGANVNGRITRPGFIFTLVIRLLLDSCTSTEEALETLEDIPHMRCFNYLIVDKSGKAIGVEATTRKLYIREPSNGLLAVTNHFTDSDACMRFEQIEQRPTDSIIRYQRTLELLNRYHGEIDESTFMEILSDHKGYICEHVRKMKLGTLWSLIASPCNKSVLIAEGHPCMERFHEFRLKERDGFCQKC